MKRIISIQSHVVFGCAGNSSAVFPMRRSGMNVLPINTVQFSNHTQYAEGWKGMVMPAGQITELIQGLDNIGVLKTVDALLSGYLGSAAQGEEIVAAVEKLKAVNPNAIYFCDPVMGHPEKGCIVAPGVSEFLSTKALAVADVVAPNLLELETLTDRVIHNLDQAIDACERLIAKGIKMVVVKHLARSATSTEEFEILLVTTQGAWLAYRPLYEFEKQPVGVGDLISGLMLANLMAGFEPLTAFERTNASVDAVLAETFRQKSYELQLIPAQDAIANPVIAQSAKRVK
ncbi:MAG: pyridoxal kinase PdxY [Shewanella sp.]|nr:pyridoxal kinase PdxY [Shewanella sp.]MCF1429859.1 pyridoxal kinase PdxY [Shewanella sp.]MCF1438930.1 pyridoxal kinase PdxY [Shewanella sp.]MCF1457831.1 pyridoxal kinase PdxY [Shewanella sp.]